MHQLHERNEKVYVYTLNSEFHRFTNYYVQCMYEIQNSANVSIIIIHVLS